MKVVCVGGGPASLYFSILMKRAFPDTELSVFEQNKPDDTFGWGVVFSRETLGNLEEADAESYRAIEKAFVYWDDIDTFYRGEKVTSTGHGFCGLSRKRLLLILQERARALGVKLEFQKQLMPDAIPQADVVIAADGVHSAMREKHAAVFGPKVDWRKCKFIWLGTTLPMNAFTFIFKETQWGLMQVHAYPFEPGTGTFIVEMREEVWRKAGLDTLGEAESVAFLEKVFADDLKGHRLLANKSIWRTFPTISCRTWVNGNTVLLGDAAHTAHFSIGSGTKLAMEDAIALAAKFKALGPAQWPQVLKEYDLERQNEVARIQRAAQTSLEWFENSGRYMGQPLIQLEFNLMTRSKRITWANLRARDPKLVADTDAWFAKSAGSAPRRDGSAPPPVFAPLKLRGLTLPNRIVVSPMCQYSAKGDGVPHDFHLVHYGSRAMGGAGLVFTEMTDVSPEGRITLGCTGLWNDAQEAAWKRIVEFVHGNSRSKVGIQLGHAGRKASCQLPWEGDSTLGADQSAWQTIAPSAIPYAKGWHTPRAMEAADFAKVKADHVAAVERAQRCGFDVVELHAAHGYLLSEFLSPLCNQRSDAYGGSLENRLRFPLEVFDAMRAAWPKEKPLFVRITASDWLGPDGVTGDDAVEIARAFKAHGADVLDVSSGGNVPESSPEFGRMFQVPFAEAVRYGTGVTTMAVGGIQSADHANTIIAAGRADLCAIAKGHLSDPYLTHRHAQEEGVDSLDWPKPYFLVRPQRKR
jgi:anthraniloyl-CoA monooxygenase